VGRVAVGGDEEAVGFREMSPALSKEELVRENDGAVFQPGSSGGGRRGLRLAARCQQRRGKSLAGVSSIPTTVRQEQILFLGPSFAVTT
jgi:hypothetical protein